jgi:hypothetical protein
MDKTQLLKIALLTTSITMGILTANSKFNVAQASLDGGRPLVNDQGCYCCMNGGNDCGAACCP